jgi:hypothetical protein
LTDLTFQSHGTSGSGIDPINGILTVGILGDTHSYTGFSGPTSFGSGGFLSASSGSGDIVGIFAKSPSQIIVPQGYVSGNALSDSSTFNGKTFASLGVNPGTYAMDVGDRYERGQLHASNRTRWRAGRRFDTFPARIRFARLGCIAAQIALLRF